MSKEEIQLATLGGGAAAERVGLALQDILQNIQDPNTDAEKPRSITLKITFRPDSTRECSDVLIAVEKKLAPIKAVGTVVFFERDINGRVTASEHKPKRVEGTTFKTMAEATK